MSGDCCEDAEEETWNSLAISALPGLADEEADRAGSFEDPTVKAEAGGLPLTWKDGVADTNPKDFTLSVLTTCVAASEDDKGGEVPSMESKVTAEPGEKDKEGKEDGDEDVPCLTEPT